MLSDLTVRQAKATGKTYTLADLDGLSLFVSANGAKAWHFRFSWGGKRDRMSFGPYPALSLKDARALRDEARTLLTKGVNPHTDRKRQRHTVVLAGEHTFKAVYDQWLAYRKLSLDEGRQTSLEQIGRVFKKDVFPALRPLTIYDIKRAHLLDIIGKVEKRGSLSVAEKLRTWFTQLFTYATVAVPNMTENPSNDLEVVALPLPPVEHNPFLRMPELPIMLQTLRKYRGRLNTQLGLRLLFLTGVRTGELRFATPDQFDLDQGLWIIPVARLKQRKMLTQKKRKRLVDIRPYIVPLPDLSELGEFILRRSRQAVVDAIAKVPQGSWSYRLQLDGYEEAINIVARVTVAEGKVVVSFDGTSAPVRKAINVPRSYAVAYAVYGLACALAGNEVPNNAGSLSAFEVDIPEGCILDARRPLPVGHRHIVGQMIPDAVFGCLSQPMPDRVPAEGTSCIWNISCRGTRVDRSDPSTFSLSLTTNGGTGARPALDGLSATAFPSGVQATSVEIFETRTPLVVWRKELRTDSGGAGTSRGGLGQHIEISNRENAAFSLNAAFDRIAHPARGRAGGESGSAGYVGLASGAILKGKGLQVIPAGEFIVIHTPGGGGIGSPQRRSRASVEDDLRQGLVSVEAAVRTYELESLQDQKEVSNAG